MLQSWEAAQLWSNQIGPGEEERGDTKKTRRDSKGGSTVARPVKGASLIGKRGITNGALIWWWWMWVGLVPDRSGGASEGRGRWLRCWLRRWRDGEVGSGRRRVRGRMARGMRRRVAPMSAQTLEGRRGRLWCVSARAKGERSDGSWDAASGSCDIGSDVGGAVGCGTCRLERGMRGRMARGMRDHRTSNEQTVFAHQGRSLCNSLS